MKKVIVLFGLIWLSSCDSENAWDCIQTAGEITEKVVQTPQFSRVTVNRGIKLIVEQGDEFEVKIISGSNIIEDVRVSVNGNRLVISDENSCNWVRDYELTTVHITVPDLQEIRNSSQYKVESSGTLNFENLSLISENFNDPDSFNVGDFDLNLEVTDLNVAANGLSIFSLSGNVENLFVGFYAGSGRLEGAALIAQQVEVFHRGSNDMIINAVQSLSGELRSTGNLISVGTPNAVDVQQYYTGELIFLD